MMRYRAWRITVPLILLLGFASGWISNSGDGNPWFDRLAKPAFMPPGWAFPIAWTLLYILIAIALALVIDTSGPRRGAAITLFGIQLALNLAWSPVFFGLHRPMTALAIIVLMMLFAGVATIRFMRLSRTAGLLMLPYLAWLLFAATLNLAIVQMNIAKPATATHLAV